MLDQEPDLPEFLSKRIEEEKNRNATVICANASALDSFEGKDLYGLDSCINLADKLRNQSKPFFFIFNVTSLHIGRERYESAKQRIAALHLEDHLLLMNESISFVKLMEVADIVLRPTLTDGDSLSVREALYLDKTVIASDVVSRPNGVVLYKTEDAEDLFLKVLPYIVNLPQNKQMINAIHNHENAFEFYDMLFQKMLKKNNG